MVKMVLSVYLLALTFIWTGMASKFVVSPCDPHLFDSGVNDCLSDFNRSMESSGYRESCPWPTAKGNYNELKTCVDDWANATLCRGHGSLKDDIFLAVHKTYFKRCEKFRDPSPTTLAALIAPVVVVTLFLPIVCAHLATRNAYWLDSPGL
ncbi:receptor activity-modifying protein 1-like isoform X2 [Pseudoliparis swirei]|uniref:receptor activity-modifying protein 1-like isoform X2 n=2 Tax=Pseudoliparis swirei TaxID=2059687 RepID=UPI0024BED4FB|nr:receptor activity-modifying protein 1-like isoform X2 [Pseudoliparis swirei]